ncbi:MAG TPA: helix-hairpin-helix domain-containing protein [Bryobacteraceae bacterium]|nr:helix-hairpin-helix domain-containing protein [Bryobacteraceae bacterium]
MTARLIAPRITWLGALALLSVVALPAQDLPEGPGKDLFANVCSSCHPLDYATKKRLSPADWKAMVNTMAARGAEATKAELDTITAYLVKNYPVAEGSASPIAAAAGASKEMPEGQGKQIILRECTACHLPDHFTKYQHTPEEWQAIVIRMGTRVRSATKDELDTVTKYLATNYPKVEVAGKVNVNKAKAAELQSQFSLTPEEADAVVKYRERHGDFREWGELLAIYGVDGRKIEAAKDRMSF